jgi:hypothetical protein
MSDWFMDWFMPKIGGPFLLMVAIGLLLMIPFVIYQEYEKVCECRSKGGVYIYKLSMCYKSDSVILLEE